MEHIGKLSLSFCERWSFKGNVNFTLICFNYDFPLCILIPTIHPLNIVVLIFAEILDYVSVLPFLEGGQDREYP